MKIKIILLAAVFALVTFSASAQTPQLIKRTTTKTDRFDFGSGGTVSIAGAPIGSIRVIGSPGNEIEITAEIEVQAANEADLALLSQFTTFITDESALRTGVISLGTHNKGGLKKLPKKFPKHLLGLPFRIDYVVRVPHYSDLEIDGGSGDLEISGVEGSMRINFIETNAKLDIISGSTTAIIGSGNVDIGLGVKGWRGRTASIQLGTGTLTVRLPSNLSAELDATVLRTGVIENTLQDLKPRDRKVQFTDKSISAKAGVGGPAVTLSVGDGTLRLVRLSLPM